MATEMVTQDRSLKEQWLEEKQKALKELYPHVGQFFEINGFLFRVRKLGKKGDVILRRFTGAIEVPKVNATATMIAGARKA